MISNEEIHMEVKSLRDTIYMARAKANELINKCEMASPGIPVPPGSKLSMPDLASNFLTESVIQLDSCLSFLRRLNWNLATGSKSSATLTLESVEKDFEKLKEEWVEHFRRRLNDIF